jgi:hypothetical protein
MSQKALSEITSSTSVISALIQIRDIVSADLSFPVKTADSNGSNSSAPSLAPSFAPSLFPLSYICNISYHVYIPSTKELGYHTPIEAYNATSVFLQTSLTNGKFLQFWQETVNFYQLSSTLFTIQPLSNIEIGTLSSDYNFPIEIITDDDSTTDNSKFSTAMIITISCAVVMALLCCPFIALFSLYIARQIMKFRTKVTFISDENGNMIEMADAHYIEENNENINLRNANFLSVLPPEQLPHAKPVSAAVFARAEPVVPFPNAHTNGSRDSETQRPHRHHHRRSNRIQNSEN